MKLIKPSFEFLTELNRIDILKLIERAGRTCYKSDSAYTEKTGSEFLKMIAKRGHFSVIEHVSISVRFVCDRGVTHELVRHRIASYSQESTRYCNYQTGVTFIIPLWLYDQIPEGEYTNLPTNSSRDAMVWISLMLDIEGVYERVIKQGWIPQQARSILPNSLKTEIITTANLREWKHIFDLRCSEKAHPQIREIMIPVREIFREKLPELYE